MPVPDGVSLYSASSEPPPGVAIYAAPRGLESLPPSLAQRIQASFDKNTTTSPKEPLLETGLKSVVGAIGSPFVHPIATLDSAARMLEPAASGNNTLGNMIKGIGADYKQGGVPYAGTKLGGNILGGVALGEAGAGLLNAVKAASIPNTIPGQNYTPAHAAAFEGLTSKASGMGKNFIPQQLTPEALSPIRQAAADMKSGTPTEQAIARVATGKGAPLDRLAAIQNVIQRSLTDLEGKHAPALQAAGSSPVDMSPIQQALKAQIVRGMSSADVAGIQDLIDRSGQIRNLNDLNGFRQILNSESSPAYRQSPTQMGRASAPQSTASDIANMVRQHYFDNLKQATGIDFSPLKAKESNILTVKEALENITSPQAKAEAAFNSPSTPRAKLGEAGEAVVNIVKNPKKLIQQQILRESPATDVANLIRKSLTNLPEPTPQSPPTVSPIPKTFPQLPSNATPATVQGTSVPTPPQPLGLPSGAQAGLPSGVDPRFLTQVASPGEVQTPQTPYPALNEATARTRVNPIQFAETRAIPAAGARPVTLSGEVLAPIQRFLQAGDLDPSITNPSVDDLKRAITAMRKKRGK